ncbi:MerC domain-containing protein [Sphingomonas sp. LHG3406-1]|uniref:MerC domain-containing protein n=1 Tax=Sphingomonas sp. LHG3406-1 TaxID=2804617 RepID=UPI00260BC8F5|nr:MerC domain-containing protein [Sphingomonas sp. LHG3406-1]
MNQTHASTHTWDRLAIGLSGLCLVHCVATTIFLAAMSAFGGLLGSHWVHEVGLTLAMTLGAFALGRGMLDHGFMMPSAVGGLGLGVMAGSLTLPHDGTEAAATMLGVLILALGHDLNRRGTSHPFGRR